MKTTSITLNAKLIEACNNPTVASKYLDKNFIRQNLAKVMATHNDGDYISNETFQDNSDGEGWNDAEYLENADQILNCDDNDLAHYFDGISYGLQEGNIILWGYEYSAEDGYFSYDEATMPMTVENTDNLSMNKRNMLILKIRGGIVSTGSNYNSWVDYIVETNALAIDIARAILGK
jgi:hypothetical protein